MAKRAFIIHGWEGTANSGWKGWLKGELEERGFLVFSPQMPDAENPKLEEWLATLHKLVGRPDKDTYFIGHSLGVVCILRYLERLGKGEKAGGALLVAGPTENPGIPQIAGFFKMPFEWEKIRRHCAGFVSINSDNDFYIDLRHGKVLEEKLGAKLIMLHKRGHFSHSEGCNVLPEALEALLGITHPSKTRTATRR